MNFRMYRWTLRMGKKQCELLIYLLNVGEIYNLIEN